MDKYIILVYIIYLILSCDETHVNDESVYQTLYRYYKKI